MLRKYLGEGGWVAFGQVASVLGSLILVRVLTEHLSPAEYGKLALLLTLVGFANQIFFAGLTQALTRYYSIAKSAGELGIVILSGCLIFSVLIVMLALFVFTIVFHNPILESYFSFETLLVAIVFAILIETYSVLNFLHNAARRRMLYAASLVLFPWLKLIFSLCLILLWGSDVLSVVIGYIISATILISIQLIAFLKMETLGSIHWASCVRWGRDVFRYAFPFMAWGSFTWGQQSIDRWALEWFSNSTAVGQYAALFQVGYTPMSLTATMIVTYIYPIIFGATTDRAENASQIIQRTVLLNAIFVVFICGICMILHDSIFGLMVGRDYISVSFLLPWMILAGGLFGCGQILTQQMMVYMRPSSLLGAKICTAIIGIVLSILGARWAGTVGVVIASIIFGAVYFIWIWAIVSRHKAQSQAEKT